MIQSFDNVLSEEYIDFILNLPQVIDAKEIIDNKSLNSIYFNIQLPLSIINIIKDRINLDLTNNDNIPMRWIKGDIPPHVDHGENSFNNTYLIYLTNSQGQLIIEDRTYPITQGSAYIFNENLNHETINTGSEPRLLLGPMNENGLTVGMFSISQNGGNTIYIRDNDGTIEYSSDNQETWNEIYWPCAISNTDTDAGILKIEFINNINIDTQWGYFEIGSNKIQIGSDNLLDDGTRPIITINTVTDYNGLVRNGSEYNDGYNNIFIYNLDIHSLNSNINSNAGWIGYTYFGKGAINNYIINCSSDGEVGTTDNEYCGGIVGSYSGINNGTELYLINCFSSNKIWVSSGGIVGAYSGSNNGSVIIKSCFTTGQIAETSSGGILGPFSENATILNCYSTGNISGEISGGIIGYSCQNINIINCYSSGSVSGTSSGAITSSNVDNITINNCYSTGNITGATTGGICGNLITNTTISHCYTTGTVSNNNYIIGGTSVINGAQSSNTISNCYSEAYNTSSGWNYINSNTVLTGLPNPIVGTVWVDIGPNQPYELFNIGYNPYSLTNISSTPDIIKEYSLELLSSDVSSVSGLFETNYYIIDITGNNTNSYESININSSDGIISTSSTESGTYTIYIKYNNNNYNYSIINLIITDDLTEISINIASKLLDNGLDRRSIYNCINSVIINNTELNNNKRTNINNALIKAFNLKIKNHELKL